MLLTHTDPAPKARHHRRRWAGLKKLDEGKGQAVHPRLSQCQLSRDSLLEEKRLTVWKQGHTSERRFRAPAYGGGFFLPQHEGNACVGVTQGQSSERRAFPQLCVRLCDVPLSTTSTGDAYLFWPLLRPPNQISRYGLSALPRDLSLSGI